MSQLYQLFCEGLRSRAKHEGLSSTAFCTSTPLDYEEESDDGFVAALNNVAPPVTSSRYLTENDLPLPVPVSDKASPNLSMEGQVGSASMTQSQLPAAGDMDLVPSPANACVQVSKQPPCLPCSHKEIVKSISRPLSQSPRLLKEWNRDASSIDFIDQIVAQKLCDRAQDNNEKQKAASSVSCNESRSQNNQPVASQSKRVSDSSETDFEGASQYYLKLSSPSFSARTKQVVLKNTRKPRPSINSRKSSSGESLKLVMDSLSDSDLSSQDTEEDEIDSLTAARCRIFSKPKVCQLKSLQSSPTPSQNAEEIMLPRVENTQNEAQLPNENSEANNQADVAFKRNSNLFSILKSVVAYVEVRSGHDNRSMGVRTRLRGLGATVLVKFTSEVTHVVFNEGAPSILKQAQKHGCHIVSVLWIAECEKLGHIAPEDEHPPLNMHLYQESHITKKYRKMKSLQPDFEEGKREERIQNYVKRFRRKAQQAGLSQTDENKSIEESSDKESQAQKRNREKPAPLIPEGIAMKRLSVVLYRIDATDTSGCSDKRNKRRLMPLHGEIPCDVPLEDFDPAERLKPQCPYTANSERTSKQKPVLSQRRPTRQTSAPVSGRRRSSCFVRGTKGATQPQSNKKVKTQMPTMVCTFMHRRDIDVVAAVIKELGGWILEPFVSSRTTHVVCGDSKRTINLLKGIAYGCWIVHQEWVMRSIEAGHWLNEEPFELTIFPAIQQCRVARETLGVCPNIFNAVGEIFVAKDTTPPQSDLLDLLQLYGAHFVNAARLAKVIVGQYQRRASHTNVVHVSEKWVLDSIQENMLQPMQHYTI